MNTNSSKTPRCQICRKALTCAESIKQGIGPECLQKRSSYLAAAGSCVGEIESLAQSSNPQILKWLRCLLGAIGAGRQNDVERFLTAARAA